jgi:hypothetical protein
MEAERDGKVLRSWRKLKPEQTVNSVCARCNNGWMSELENRVKPIVEALFSEEPVTLKSDDQATLALWSVKNAMVFEELRGAQSRFFVQTERKALKETLQPTQLTSVWIAKCVWHGGPYCSASNLSGVVEASADQVKAYITTMCFGPLAIQVGSIKLPESIGPGTNVTADMRPGPWPSTALQIWPTQQEQVCWPPSVDLLGEAGLEEFRRRWSPVNQ